MESATTKKCVAGYNYAGEILTFWTIQTGRNGEYHSSLAAQNPAAKRSVLEVESSSQELLKHSLKIAKLQSGIHRDEKEGTSIDDEFTKQKLITL